MIDSDGYRPNVGIILSNDEGKVLWAQRLGQKGWQFPQGGIRRHEKPEQAMFRELREEIGLKPEHVKVLGRTEDWLHYDLPERFVRRNSRQVCIGQKQIWFLLRLIDDERHVCFDHSEQPEFEAWEWVDYWMPAKQVVEFKREVYLKALKELESQLDVSSLEEVEIRG